ncbi:PadR family transcriptional regulator [Nocardioides alcanivorans]|uniref:PadR family transcriptional regulator n=1 Tax=Nocardioides alcanivorans TaxID=2897352 RepID=UPI001F3FF6CE|nr:PadR family transcriptional regulator [Nocardioides alcanivorans]
MALEHALLVSLAERAASGLELTRRFDASIGFFWQASHQQIYRTLRRMEADGWLTSVEVAQAKRPAKLVYDVTSSGHEELRRWLAEPTPAMPQRSDLAVKLRGAWLGDAAAPRPGHNSPPGRGNTSFVTKTMATKHQVPRPGGESPTPPDRSAERQALLADVRRHLAVHATRLEHYRHGCARDYPDPRSLTGGDLDRYLVLRGGILQEEYWVSWLTEYLAAFPAK